MMQSENKVSICGVLQQVNLTTGTDSNNNPYIRGDVTINVDQSWFGHDDPEHEEVKVSMYARKFKNDGNPNPAYKSIEDLNNYKRISADGENADEICLRAGRLQEYAFVPKGATEVRTGWQVNGTFFNKPTAVDKEKEQSYAKFNNDIFIREISNEVDSDGEETGRLKIVGILIGYNDRADVMTYYVENKQAVAYISKHWNEGDTVNAVGRIRRTLKTVTSMVPESNGFGETMATGGSRTVTELIITGTNNLNGAPYTDDKAFDEDEVRAAMGERMNRINAAGQPKKAPAAKPKRGW